MARSAAAKKVAKAASTGAAGKGFKVNRSLLFPGAMALVVLIGIALVLLARDRRADDAFDANQHWYLTYDFYRCDGYLDQSFLPTELDLPIRAEGDGLIHVQPFHGDVTGSTGTVGAFMAVVQAAITDDSVQLPDETVLSEADVMCAPPDGGEEAPAEMRVLRWNSVDSPAPAVFESSFENVRLNDNGQVVAFAMVHPDLSNEDIPLPDTTALRLQLGLETVGPLPTLAPDTEIPDGGLGGDESDGDSDRDSGDVETDDGG